MRLLGLAPLALAACLLPGDAVVCYYGCAVGERIIAERGSAWCDLRLAEAEAACAPRPGDPCAELLPPCRERPGCEALRILVCTAPDGYPACADFEACRTRGIYERKSP